MGVRRLFSRGGQKIFQGGGQEPTFGLKNNKNSILFFPKSLSTYYFWPARGGGQELPLPSPADAHEHLWMFLKSMFFFSFGDDDSCKSECNPESSSDSDPGFNLDLESNLVLTRNLINFVIDNVYKFLIMDWLDRNESKFDQKIAIRLKFSDNQNSVFRRSVFKYLEVSKKTFAKASFIYSKIFLSK